jgi:DNA-binding transcriptional LysR family regulator
LASLGQTRRIVLTVNQFFTAGRVVSGSDLLTVLPRHFVNVTGMASELMVRDLPFDVPPVHVDSLWHIRQGQRKEHAWLRLAVAAAAAKAFSASRPGA